jgi:hypothetical protein
MKKVKHFKPILTKIGIDLLLHLSCNSVWPFITGHFVFCTSRAMGVHHCEQGKKLIPMKVLKFLSSILKEKYDDRWVGSSKVGNSGAWENNVTHSY